MRFGGKMDDGIDVVLAQQVVDQGAVANIAVDEVYARPGSGRSFRFSRLPA